MCVCVCQEAFQAAKLAYRQFKLRVKKTLSPSHLGPETLEDSVVDYIVRNLDLYDVQASVNVWPTLFSLTDMLQKPVDSSHLYITISRVSRTVAH